MCFLLPHNDGADVLLWNNLSFSKAKNEKQVRTLFLLMRKNPILISLIETDVQMDNLKKKNIFIFRKALCSALPMLLGSAVANKPIKLSLEAETLASLVRNTV